MKFFRIIFIVFQAFFITSCSDIEKDFPSNQIFVFSSSEDSLISRLYLDDFLSKKNRFLPTEEPYYEVAWLPEEAFSDYKGRPLVILIKLENGSNQNEDKLYNSFFKNSKESSKIKFVDNFYNNNQAIIGVEAFDGVELNSILFRYSDIITNKINKVLDTQILKKYTSIPKNDKISDYIFNKYGIELFIDHNYQNIKEKNDILWIGRGFPSLGDPYRWIVVRETNYFESPKDYLSVIEQTFNDYLLDSNYIDFSSFYDKSTYKYEFEDNYFIGGTYIYSEIEIENYKLDTIPTAGGPFISYIFNDSEKSKSTIITGLVNNPGSEKMIYIKQLESIFKNIKNKGK